MQKFDTPAPISAILDIAAGRVEVIATDRADTVVRVRPGDPGRGRDVRAAEQTTVAYADGQLRVRTAGPRYQIFGPSGCVEVTIELPAGSRVRATSDSTEVCGVGRLGEVDVKGAYRRISIEEAASVRLTAIDGDVEIGRVHGAATISTNRGDIRVAEAASGTVELRTGFGGITVGAAAGVSAAMDAGTRFGRIHNALANDGATRLQIRATTSYGDISARSL